MAGGPTGEERDEQLMRYERVRAQTRPDGRPYTDSDCAREMGVSTKTIQRWRKELKEEGRVLKRDIPPASQYSQSMRDEIFERNVDTFDMIRRAILRTERTQALLDAELGFDEERCECCGRSKLGGDKQPDFLKWQTAFKGGETMNNQIITLAKMLGQISDNQLILVQQMDEDLMLIMRELAKLDRGTATQLYMALISQSERRRQRLPEATQVFDGEWRQLDGPGQPVERGGGGVDAARARAYEGGEGSEGSEGG